MVRCFSDEPIPCVPVRKLGRQIPALKRMLVMPILRNAWLCWVPVPIPLFRNVVTPVGLNMLHDQIFAIIVDTCPRARGKTQVDERYRAEVCQNKLDQRIANQPDGGQEYEGINKTLLEIKRLEPHLRVFIQSRFIIK